MLILMYLPRLLVQTPYNSSTKAKEKFNNKNRNKLREFLSENISLIHPDIFSLIRELILLESL